MRNQGTTRRLKTHNCSILDTEENEVHETPENMILESCFYQGLVTTQRSQVSSILK